MTTATMGPAVAVWSGVTSLLAGIILLATIRTAVALLVLLDGCNGCGGCHQLLLELGDGGGERSHLALLAMVASVRLAR